VRCLETGAAVRVSVTDAGFEWRETLGPRDVRVLVVGETSRGGSDGRVVPGVAAPDHRGYGVRSRTPLLSRVMKRHATGP
jgi:hypothetical protein